MACKDCSPLEPFLVTGAILLSLPRMAPKGKDLWDAESRSGGEWVQWGRAGGGKDD